MTSFEREKGKNTPKRVDLSSRAAENGPEQSKSVDKAVNSTSGKTSPASKSTDSDTDRRKFFQSLLQSKNDTLSNTIPEESESGPNSPVQWETQAGNEGNKEGAAEKDVTDEGATKMEATRDITPSECNGDEKLKPSEEGSSNVEDSLSVTGVCSEIRGAEVAEEPVDHEEPDKVLNTEDVRESSDNEKTETDAAENAATSSSTENNLTENDQVDNRDESSDDKRTEASPEVEESNEKPPVNEGESIEKSGNRTESDSAPPKLITENNTNSKEGQDLFYDRDKPKDVDSSLTIAVKSSYIGAASEVAEHAQSNNEVEKIGEPEKKVVTSEDVAKSEEQSVAQSKESSVQNPSVESLKSGKPTQSSSPNTPSHTGAESSPTSTPSAASAATSNAGSPEQKSTYRAHVNIPEYLWSPVHQRLLGDLLFAIESDVHVWRR